MPNHEPRGCSRGASYSWYLYSASRHEISDGTRPPGPAVARSAQNLGPVAAWAAIIGNADKTTTLYKIMRGRGGFVRSTWDEVTEIIAAANIHTIKTYGPDRVVGFSPIPAMSMVSYASGARYLSLIGGTLLSFYDWYCDLPPSSPQTWGEQTDVPESADWYNSGYIIAWGSNVPQTRTPDAHFFVEARYNGTKVVAITPGLFGGRQAVRPVAAPQAGHRRRPRHGHGSCDPARSSSSIGRCPISRTIAGAIPTCRCWCRSRADGERWVPDRYLRAERSSGCAGPGGAPEWKTVGTGRVVGRDRLAARFGGLSLAREEGEAAGKWNLEDKDGATGREVRLALSLIDRRDESSPSPSLISAAACMSVSPKTIKAATCCFAMYRCAALTLADGESLCRYRVRSAMRQLRSRPRPRGASAHGYRRQRSLHARLAGKDYRGRRGAGDRRGAQFAENAEKTKGRSMVIIGAGMNHWYHQDMNYRSIINILMMCGTVGVSGGGWAHYVGQEKLQTADRLGGAGLRAGLGAPAAPDERHLVLLCTFGPMALREACV